MSEPSHCIADPLPEPEARLLRAYVERDPAELAALGGQGEEMRALVQRGLLRIEDRGVLVTPEGLACALT